jgi:hypothetical protein
MAFAAYKEEWLNTRQLDRIRAATPRARPVVHKRDHDVRNKARSSAARTVARKNHSPELASSDPIRAFSVNGRRTR